MMKKFKKLLNIFLCIALFLSLFVNPLVPVAEEQEKYIGTSLAEDGLRVRKGPGTKYESITKLPLGSTVDMVDTVKVADEGGCNDGWYKIYYVTDKVGYVCSTYLEVMKKIEENVTGEPRNEYEKQLQELGFPSTYWASLSVLHEKHPTWVFEPLMTNLEWQSAVASESILGMSFIQTSSQGYRSTEARSYDYLTDTFTPQEGSNWYAANRQVVAYYLDPRNYLNEKQIFAFEKLSYDAASQTKEALQGIVGTSSYLNNYLDDFIKAGETYNVSPVYLLSRVRQETGLNGGVATKGGAFTYDGVTYSGIYNLYNIGATTGSNPVVKGLYWARGGAAEATSYGRPWTSITKSIMGGAEFLAHGYINAGQYTDYLQKFNVNPNGSSSLFSHQYMTNIQAPSSEASSVYNAYAKMELLETSFKFTIPVFNNMGVKSELPDPGNPNNHLKDLKVNGMTVVGFAHDNFTYNVAVSKESTSAIIEATKINDKATVSGVGTIALVNDVTPVSVQVKAENGEIQEYKINIIKTEGALFTVAELLGRTALKSDGTYISGVNIGLTGSGIKAEMAKVSGAIEVKVKDANGVEKSNDVALATGDVVTIVNGVSSGSYTIVIYGDCNGDGNISIADLLKVQKNILGYEKLNGAYSKAGDASKNNKVAIEDLLSIQKHILGYKEISQ